MLTKITLITVIYLVLSMVYSIIGHYALLLNRKKNTNRLFFLIAHALSIWALCFGLRNFTTNESLSLFLTRISVLGWGTIYALIYHFIVTLRDPDKAHSPWFYLLLYGSSLLNIAFFLFYPILAGEPSYNHLTEWGWTVITPASRKEMYYNTYYVFFIAVAYYQLYKWFKESKGSHNRYRIKIISLSLVFVALVGIPTEIVFNRVMGRSTVQTMVIWMFIPLFVMYYSIQKYRFLHPVYKMESNQVVDDISRNKIFQIVGYLFIIASYLLLSIYYLAGYDYVLEHRFSFSAIVYFMGVVYLRINYVKISDSLKYWFLTLTGSSIIFISTLAYSKSGSVTAWSMFFVFIIISVVFDHYKYGYFMTAAMVVFQIMQWSMLPYYHGILVWKDYALRIAISLITLSVTNYIAKLYFKKNNEIYNQILVEETITEASRIFINITKENRDEKISGLFKLCSENLNYIRVYLCRIVDGGDYVLMYHYEGGRFETQFAEDKFSDICNVVNSKEVKEELSNFKAVIIEDLRTSALDEAVITEALAQRKVVGFHAFPIIMTDELRGVLVFETAEKNKTDYYHDYKQIFANLIVEAHKRVIYENQLQKNAYYDEITGLYKKRRFNDVVSSIIDNSIRNQRHAMLFIDIDDFKNLNDVFGHILGDAVLVKIADIIRQNANSKYIAARFGGDEFIVFCPNVSDEEEVIKFVESIIEQSANSVEIDGHELRLSLSVGIAKYPMDGESLDAMLKNADLAMYASKRNGKGGYSLCNPDVKNIAAESVIYSNLLTCALEKDQFKLVYQPQMSVKTGKIIGTEALLRWHSVDFGIVSPLKFIPLLEHSGLINDVGTWVIEQAVAQQRKMVELGYAELRMAINLSPVQFQDQKLFNTLYDLVKVKGIDPTLIELEITESVALSETSNLMEKLGRLKALGYRIAIDDFGVDFSSLHRLQILPVDRLKIDKSFIDGISFDDKKEKATLVIINMAKSLGLKTTAEGVSREEQVDFLMNTSCDEIQGFFYSEPLYAKEFEAFTKIHY